MKDYAPRKAFPLLAFPLGALKEGREGKTPFQVHAYLSKVRALKRSSSQSNLLV